MSSIAPNSTIELLTKVPLDITHEDTIYFSSISDQSTYFLSHIKRDENHQPITIFEDNMYQRVDSNIIALQCPIETVYDCNYLRFRNDTFEDKWFYAFITNIKYKSNNVTIIEYKIDVIQTWWFSMVLEPCFVEREHAASDLVGEHTLPEGLEIGTPKLVDQRGPFDSETDFSMVIAAPYAIDDVGGLPAVEYWYGGFYNGIASGLVYNVYDNATPDKSYSKFFYHLKDLTEKHKSEIVAVFQVPTVLLSASNTFTPNPNQNVYTTWETGYITRMTYRQSADSSPTGQARNANYRNHKLYTFPFSYLYVTSSDGDSAVYRIEYSNNAPFDVDAVSPMGIDFALTGCMGMPPEMQITPKDYHGVLLNYNESLVVSNFPQCTWVTDAFKAWLAQNSVRMIGTAVTTVGSLALMGVPGLQGAGAALGMASQATGTALSTGKAAIGIAGAALGVAGQVTAASQMPRQTHGTNRGMVSVADNEFGFHIYGAYLKDEFAEVIDSYFDRFGYACRKTKVPNTHAREYWTYTKTIGCHVHAKDEAMVSTLGIPGNDVKEIEDIFDHGITIWRNRQDMDVGNYIALQDLNTPTGEVGN